MTYCGAVLTYDLRKKRQLIITSPTPLGPPCAHEFSSEDSRSTSLRRRFLCGPEAMRSAGEPSPRPAFAKSPLSRSLCFYSHPPMRLRRFRANAGIRPGGKINFALCNRANITPGEKPCIRGGERADLRPPPPFSFA